MEPERKKKLVRRLVVDSRVHDPLETGEISLGVINTQDLMYNALYSRYSYPVGQALMI